MKMTGLTLSAVLLSTTCALANPAHHGARIYSPELYADAPVEGTFSRMFPLDDFGISPHPSPRYDLLRLGAVDGPMNEGAGGAPVGDSRIEAGITFLGQFVDHDITLDLTSTLDAQAVPEETRNFRTPDLDLDCVYGDGPEGSPWLYQRNMPFLIVGRELPMGRNDLARVQDTGIALIGDPRNDENFIVSQVHASFVAFHNKVAKKHLEELVAAAGQASFDDLSASEKAAASAEAFEAARDDVIHYYHRMLAEYFLPKVIGVTRTVDIATNGRRFYQAPEMPVEFSAAAFRFGHSQVRQQYTLRMGGTPENLFESSRQGFSPLADASMIDFAKFFPLPTRTDPSEAPQPTRKLDPRLPDVLFKLGAAGVTPAGAEASLASRNLSRGRSFRLPAGEDLFEIVAGATASEVAAMTKENPMPHSILLAESAKIADETVQASLGATKQAFLRLNPLVEQDKIAPDLDAFTMAPTEIKEALVVEKSPLWYYVLHEASEWQVSFVETPDSNHVWPTEVALQDSVLFLTTLSEAARDFYWSKPQPVETGQVLGPVGGTIVGEVILGLIDDYREKTNKGLDHVPGLKPDDFPLTDYTGFGERMTYGDMIAYIEWDKPL